MVFTMKMDKSNVFNFFSLFSNIKYFVLYEVTFLLRFISLSLKSAFTAKFAFANLTAKFSAVNLLNSGVVMYFSCL